VSLTALEALVRRIGWCSLTCSGGLGRLTHPSCSPASLFSTASHIQLREFCL
jgi:hypothetical protein